MTDEIEQLLRAVHLVTAPFEVAAPLRDVTDRRVNPAAELRIVLLHHVTWSINSICHLWGRRRFNSRDESRNVWWLSWISFGESWHNNHHAFPSSAFHGLRGLEIDPGGWVIWTLEKCGLAWGVVRIPADRQAAKLAVRS